MKKQYIPPELGTKPYAQFENVFTGCSKANGCPINPAVTASGKDKITGLQVGNEKDWTNHGEQSSFIS